MLSPGRSLPFSRLQSSGRWRFGSHWPLASRTEKTRSFARERSSSRRAPPIAASKLPACSASSSALVFSRPQQRWVPDLERLRAVADRLFVGVDDQPRADGVGHLVAERDHLLELVGRVDVEERERNRAGVERLLRQAQHARGVLADGVEHHRPLELGHHFPKDLDALGLERAQMIEARRYSDVHVHRQGNSRHPILSQ